MEGLGLIVRARGAKRGEVFRLPGEAHPTLPAAPTVAEPIKAKAPAIVAGKKAADACKEKHAVGNALSEASDTELMSEIGRRIDAMKGSARARGLYLELRTLMTR